MKQNSFSGKVGWAWDNPAREYVENGILNLLCNIMISKRPRSTEKKTGGKVPRIEMGPEFWEKG